MSSSSDRRGQVIDWYWLTEPHLHLLKTVHWFPISPKHNSNCWFWSQVLSDLERWLLQFFLKEFGIFHPYYRQNFTKGIEGRNCTCWKSSWNAKGSEFPLRKRMATLIGPGLESSCETAQCQLWGISIGIRGLVMFAFEEVHCWLLISQPLNYVTAILAGFPKYMRTVFLLWIYLVVRYEWSNRECGCTWLWVVGKKN